MKKTIFFDLDGPLIDVSNKYYAVYSYILAKYGFKTLPMSLYWQMKKEKRSIGEILSDTGAGELLDTYIKERLQIIESID